MPYFKRLGSDVNFVNWVTFMGHIGTDEIIRIQFIQKTIGKSFQWIFWPP